MKKILQFKHYLIFGLFLMILASANEAMAGATVDRTWDGGGNNNNWSTRNNWTNNKAPKWGNGVIFAGTTRLLPNNNFGANTPFRLITFNNTAGAFTLTGNAINLTGNVTNNDNDLQTITLNMAMTAGRTFSAASGNIKVGGVISGAFALIKTGGYDLELAGVNTYSGGTTITAGSLTLGASGVLANGGAITLNGGTLRTGATSGYNETVGTLTLSGHSTIALGTGGHTLNFAASNGMGWTAGRILLITGWTGGWNGTSGTGGKIFVGLTSGGLTTGQLAQIYFFNGSQYYSATILGTGEVVPTSTIVISERYAVVATGNWDNTNTWAYTSGGAAGAPVPIAIDKVYIGEANTQRDVIIPSGYNAECASLTLGSVNDIANSLTLAAGTSSLVVSGNVIIEKSVTNANARTNSLNINAGSVSVGGNVKLAGTNTTANKIVQIIITSGSLTISGDLIFDAGVAANNIINMSGGAGTLNLAGAFTFTVGTLTPGTNSTFTFNGTVPQTIPIGVSIVNYNHLTINNTGAGVATISAAISATNVRGNLSVQSGTLNNGGNAITLASGKNFSMANDATFNLTGTSPMVVVSGGGGTKTFSAASTVNYAGANQTVTAETYGNLILSGSGTKTMPGSTTTVAGDFTMEGSATATPTAILTVNGITTLSGTSKLTLGAANILSNSGVIELNVGTFSTGTTTGYSETVDSLNLSDNSTITLGTGSHSLHFAAGNDTSWTSTLTITGWTGGYNGTSGTAGKIFFGNSSSGLDPTQLAQIQFYDGSINFQAIILSTGEVVPKGSSASHYFRSILTGNWSTASNWESSPNNSTWITATLAPTNAATLITIRNGHTVTVDVSNQTASSIVIESGSTLTTGSNTLLVSGNWTNDGGTFTAGSGTVTFNGTAAQAINGTAISQTFYNVIVNKSSNTLSVSGSTTSLTVNDLTETLGNFTAPATLDINGNLTLPSGTFTAGSATTIAGNWTKNGGTFTSGTGTVVFNGGSSQTISGSSTTTFNNLTINNTIGITASIDLTVNGVLSLSTNPSATKGSLDMWNGSAMKTLTMGASATTTGAGDVTGIVKRTTLIAATSYTFGNQYTTLNFQNVGTLPTDVSMKITIGTAPAWKTDAIKRTYSIIRTGGSSSFVTMSQHYLDAELNGNTENKLVHWRCITPFTPGTEIEIGRSAYDQTNNYVTLQNIDVSLLATNFGQREGTMGDSKFAVFTWNGSVSVAWSYSENWTPIGVPSDIASIVIPTNALNTHYDPTLNAPLTIAKLTIESGGIVNSPTTSTVTISGASDAWDNQGTFNAGTGTVIFTNAAATISGTTDFYNVTINSGAALMLETDATMRIGGTMTNNGTWHAAQQEHSIVEYNGGSQIVLNPNGLTPGYHCLILSGSGIKTMPGTALAIVGDFSMSGTATATAGAALTITGGFTFGSGTTFTTGALSHSIGGDFLNNGGTFTAAGSTITLNGSTAQIIGGTSATTFNNLTLNNAAGAVLGNSETVNGTLTLTYGIITTNSNTLTIDAAGAITGAGSSRYVNGKLALVYSGIGSKIFPIGKGGNYGPLTLDYTALSGTSTATAEQTESTMPGTLPPSTSLFTTRYWTITETGSSSRSYKVTLDGTGFSPSRTVIMLKGNGSTIIANTVTTPDYTNTTAFITFSDFGLGENSISTTTTADNKSVCVGETSVDLTATVSPNPGGGSVEFFVEGSSVGIAPVITGIATLAYDPSGLAAGNYTIKANFGGYGDYVSSSSYPGSNGTLSVATPSAPGVTSATICSGNTAVLSASGAVAGDKYNWYDAASGGNLLKTSTNNTDNTYTTGVLSSTTDYWVSIISSINCEGARTQVTATVTANPDLAGLATSATDVCASNASVVTISATSLPNGSYTVNYTLTGANTQDPSDIAMTVSGGNSGSFITPSLDLAGTTDLTINSLTLSSCTTAATTGNTDAITVTATGSWLGATNTDWNTPSNWCGGVPIATTDVTIPSGGNQPVIGASGGLCRNITINPSASLTISDSYNLSVSGNWTNDGSFTSGTGTVVFNGSSAQTISGTSTTTFNNLTINNTIGITASIDFTVNGVLSLSTNPSATKGSLDMWNGSAMKTLTMGASATTIGAGDVTGIVKRSGFVANLSYTFGNQYSTFTFEDVGTLPTDISMKITIGTAPSWKTGAVERTYDIIRTGANGSFGAINLHYLDAELNGNAENTLVLWDCHLPSPPGDIEEHGRSNYNTTENWVAMSYFETSYLPTAFGSIDWTLGNSVLSNATWNGAQSPFWTNKFNWTPTGVPSDLSDIIIPDAATTGYDPTLPASVLVGRLTINSGGILNATTSSIITISGDGGAWSNNGGTFNASTSTVIFTDAAATISGITNFYNVTIPDTAMLWMTTGTIMRIAGTMTNIGPLHTVIGEPSTVEYNGGNQTVVVPNPATNRYYSLILSGSGTKTMPGTALAILGDFSMSGTATATAGAALTITGDFTLGSGTTFTTGALSHSIGGNFLNNSGTFTAAGSTITLDGSNAQTIGGTIASTFDNLALNNAAGALLGNNETIDGTLTFTNGIITTGVNTLIVSNTAAAAISGASSSNYINGNLQRGIAAGANTYNFPVGNNLYTPVSIDFITCTAPGSLTVSTAAGDHSEIASSDLNGNKSVNRVWTLEVAGDLDPVEYDATFTWVEGDEDDNFDYNTAIVGKYDGANWTYPTMGTTTATSAQITGQISFSDFQVADACVDPDVPIITSSLSICNGDNVDLDIISGDLIDAEDWQWYTGSCGDTYAGNGTSINVSPTTTTTYYVRGEGGCVTPGTCASVTVTVTAPGAWIGITNTDWNTATNWCGGVPISTTDVVIPAGAPNMPVIGAAGIAVTGYCKTIRIESGAIVTIGPTGSITVGNN